jgi:hypothetical protein
MALVGFGFVGSVSPGPNDAVLCGFGLQFEFRRTVHTSWARYRHPGD